MVTIFVDATIVFLGLSFLANLVVQMLSVFRMVSFLATSKTARVFLSFVAFLLAIIYMHEVVAMLANFWGYPAFEMTHRSKEDGKYVNSSPFCLYDYMNYK